MNQNREMHWTCPKCRKPNAKRIPDDTQDGRLIAVTCETCKANYYATAVQRVYPGRGPTVFGVTWI